MSSLPKSIVDQVIQQLSGLMPELSAHLPKPQQNIFFVSYYMMWNICHQAPCVRNLLFKAHMLLRKRCEYTYTKSGKQSVLDFWRMIREPTQEDYKAHQDTNSPYTQRSSGLVLWLAPDNEVLGVAEIVEYSINRFCVKEDRKGMGSGFYKGLMSYWLESTGVPLYIRADKRVVDFFKKQGCEPLSEGVKKDERVKKWYSTRTDKVNKDVGMYDPIVLEGVGKMEIDPKDNRLMLTPEMFEAFAGFERYEPEELWNRLDPEPPKIESADGSKSSTAPVPDVQSSE